MVLIESWGTMILSRRLARQRLKLCTRAEYDTFTHNANLTPVQQHILDLYIIKRCTITNIAFRLALSDSLVRLRLAEAYDKLYKII